MPAVLMMTTKGDSAAVPTYGRATSKMVMNIIGIRHSPEAAELA